MSATVGGVAGCMGTWFEMSHGIVCIPVLTLPPFMLSQHVAIGSTVLGVAARNILSAGLFTLDPSTSEMSEERLNEIVDVSAATTIGTAGAITAFGMSTVTCALSSYWLSRLNGVFLVGVALFMNWRELRVRDANKAVDGELQRREDLERYADGPAARTARMLAAESGEAVDVPQDVRPVRAITSLIDQSKSAQQEMMGHVAMGVMSGICVGLFGIGPAWIIAPLLTQKTTEGAALAWRLNGQLTDEEIEAAITTGSGADERARLTATCAMIGPCVVSAFRHWTFGNIVDPKTIALPLAAGAIAGSAVSGVLLEDVECTEELRFGFSMLLFACGAWNFFRPR